MKLICQRCNPNEAFEIPHFSPQEKENLHHKNTLSPLLATKEVLAAYPISHKSAKFIVQHITKQYNHCNRCQSKLNDQEYTTCSKCGALNFNWKLS